jgi:tetratricopeptide (TPR) repeat protein
MPRVRMRDRIPVNENDFELLCLKLLRRRWDCPQLEQYGRRGEKQDGIDLLDLSGAEPLRAAQCRRYDENKSLPPAEIQEVVHQAKQFTPKLGFLAILTTAKVSTQADRKIVEINREHSAKGLFTIELLNWERIQQLLDEFPDVRDEFYGGADAKQLAKIDERLADIQGAIKPEGGGAPSDAHDAALDEAKGELERHEYQLAKLLLQRLRQKHWDKLTQRQRFRLVTNLGFVWLREGDPHKSASCFFEAKIYQPDDEKAVVDEVLAYYITGDLAKTFELSTALRPKFSHSALLAALWINSAPPEKKLQELVSDVPSHLISDAEVAVAIGLRALRELNFDDAEKVLRAIKTGRTDWSVVPGLLGKTIVGAELYYATKASSPPGQRRPRLLEAEELLTRAIDLSRGEKQILAAAEHLLLRAQVRNLLGDQKNFALDIEEAYRIAPSEPAAAAMMGELYRSKGDADRAIETLRQTVQVSQRVDVRYQLAAALHRRGRLGDFREAVELLIGIGKDKDLPRDLRVSVAGLALECLAKDERIEEANAFLEGFPSDYFTPVSKHTFRAQLRFRQGDLENASLEAEAALSLVAKITEAADLEYLARLLNELGRHKEALPLWQRLVRPGQLGPDPKRLLDTAMRLQRHDVVIETCESFRKEGVDNPELLQYEIAVLEQYDVNAAIRLLNDRLAKNPDDDVARLRLSLIGLNLRKNELVCADPARMPDVQQVTAAGGAAAVQVLKLGGNPDAALEYAYKLLRLHFSEPAAHRAYQFVLLPFGPQPRIAEVDIVGANAAVSYTEDGVVIPHTLVIEDPPPTGPRFNDEVSPNNPLAIELAGKRVGDRFVLATGNLSARTATVTKILNKFVYRYQDSMSEWQIRFPEDSAIESVQVVKDPGGEVDLSILMASVDRQQERAQKLEDIYRSTPIPIHTLAAQFNKNSFEGVSIVANRYGLQLNCCSGTQGERNTAIEGLKLCGEVVIDLTAIATLCLLGLEDTLRKFGIPLIVSESTLSELREMVAYEELATSKEGVFTKVEGRYALIEESAEVKAERLKSLKGLLALLESVAKILPCRELAAMDTEKRGVLDKAFGRYGAEAIVLAAAPGRMLWTDDLILARFAAGEQGVRRIWTQVALQYCAETGKIVPETYLEASARLLGLKYSFTSSNPAILVKAGRMAAWAIDTRLLSGALAQFGAPYVDLVNLLQMAALFALQLYQERIDLDTRDRVFTAVLSNLSTKPGSREGIITMGRGLGRLFGVNAVGANQASACIQRWLNPPQIIGKG